MFAGQTLISPVGTATVAECETTLETSTWQEGKGFWTAQEITVRCSVASHAGHGDRHRIQKEKTPGALQVCFSRDLIEDSVR